MNEGSAATPLVLLADDHPLVRDGLARVLSAGLPGVRIVEAASWTECLRVLQQQPIALAVLDLNMPGADGADGLQALRELRRRHAEVALIVVSGDTSPATIRGALELGVRGFIPKSDPPDVIRHAVALVWAGGSYIPPAALGAVDRLHAERSGDGASPAAGDLSALTPRQAEVLRCLARGLPNKLIARELDLTEGTVKIHIAAIMRVLRVGNRTEAVVRARALGFEP